MTSVPRVTVVIPAFNEEPTIREVITRVSAVLPGAQIIVVDDASDDATVEIARSFGSTVRVLVQESNQGKGSAVRRALPEAEGDIIVVQDADLEYFPEDLPVLLEPFQTPSVQAVYGTRFKSGRPPMRLLNYIANRILATAANVLYGASLTDEATCYKLFRREVICGLKLTCRRFEFCPEVTAKMLRSGIKIVEVPIRYNPRTAAEGKKITWRDGVQALWTLVKYRFVK